MSSLSKTVKTPVAATIGGFTALPIMSARLSELALVQLSEDDFEDDLAYVALPGDTQSIEISARNGGDVGAISYIVVSAEPASRAHALALAAVAIERTVPEAGQVVEHRRALEGDWLVIQRSHADIVVRVHAHVDGVPE